MNTSYSGKLMANNVIYVLYCELFVCHGQIVDPTVLRGRAAISIASVTVSKLQTLAVTNVDIGGCFSCAVH